MQKGQSFTKGKLLFCSLSNNLLKELNILMALIQSVKEEERDTRHRLDILNKKTDQGVPTSSDR